jgi:hypothetical protein
MRITRNTAAAARVDAVVSGSRNPAKPVQDGNYAPGVARRVQFQAYRQILPSCRSVGLLINLRWKSSLEELMNSGSLSKNTYLIVSS